jgi:hypothetical protein
MTPSERYKYHKSMDEKYNLNKFIKIDYKNHALLKLSRSFNNIFLTLKGFYRKFLISKSAAMILGNLSVNVDVKHHKL